MGTHWFKKAGLWLTAFIKRLLPYCLLLGSMGTVSCSWFLPTFEQQIATSAVWDQTSAHILILESRYQTRNPGKPYWDTTAGHTGWMTVLYTTTSANLDQRQELIRWDNTSGDAEGGSAQAVPLYWYKDGVQPGRLFYAVHGVAVVRNLVTGQRSVLRIPEAVENKYFWSHVPSADNGLPPDAFSVLPSPDGNYTAVFYQVAVLAGSIFDAMDYYKCIAIFDRQGKFIAAWDPYTDEGKLSSRLRSPLLLQQAIIVPEYDNPPRPGYQAKKPVPSYASAHFIWAKDSRSLYIAGNDSQTNFAYRLSIDPAAEPKLSAQTINQFPERAVPAPGRAVSAEGWLLSVESSPDELTARIYLHQLTDWVSHAEIQLVPLMDIEYAY